MPPGYKPEDSGRDETPVDAPKITVVKEPPADAKQADAKVEAPVTEREGLFQRAWRLMKAAASAVSNGLGFVVSKAVDGVSWLYYHTLYHVFNFVERWVPGMLYLRKTLGLYAIYAVLMGALIGGMIFTAAGMPLTATLIGIGYGAFLVPWILLTTPSLWLTIGVDLLILNLFFIGLSVTLCKILDWEGTSFWARLAHDLWPGLYENVAEWLANREEDGEAAAPAPAKAAA